MNYFELHGFQLHFGLLTRSDSWHINLITLNTLAYQIVKDNENVINSVSRLKDEQLYLSDERLGGDLRTYTRMTCIEKRLDYVLKIYQPF